ncbi:MAG: DUF63 family protein [Candidatus Aenigmatarchaeota archaeon]
MIKDFFVNYFINPIIKGSGYNIVNTLVYGIVLGLASLTIYKFLKRIGIKLDVMFFSSLIPFILLGSVVRVLKDLGIARSLLFVTPLVFVVVFSIAITTLFISIAIEKITRMEYQFILFSLGLLYLLIAFSKLAKNIIDYSPLFLVIKYTILSSILFFILYKRKIVSESNFIVVLSHCFDVSTTYVAINSSKFIEQHVLANFLISNFGAISLFLSKIIGIVLALFIIDKKIKNEEEKNFVKFVILILGLAPGLRNLLLMMCFGI